MVTFDKLRKLRYTLIILQARLIVVVASALQLMLLPFLIVFPNLPTQPNFHISPQPTPSLPPTNNITVQPTSNIYIVGNPFVDISDEGYCGVGLPGGSGSPPSLIWPVNGTVNSNRSFSIKHPAVDIYANEGDPVWAAAGGSIIWAGESSFGGGNVVVINHGSYYTTYFHLSSISVVCNQWVGQGQVVGLVGMSGASNYSHLHFGLGNGILAFDPALYIN